MKIRRWQAEVVCKELTFAEPITWGGETYTAMAEAVSTRTRHLTRRGAEGFARRVQGQLPADVAPHIEIRVGRR